MQRYVILSFDEMKTQSNLVFDKHSNELIGFVDLGDDDVNVTAFDSRSVIASHVLAFIIREVLQHRECYILPTDGIVLESWDVTCGSVLQSVMGLHQTKSFICYMLVLLEKSTTVKLYIEQSTSLLQLVSSTFFSDAPHLLKAARNCLFNSGTRKHTRLMWNGQDMGPYSCYVPC